MYTHRQNNRYYFLFYKTFYKKKWIIPAKGLQNKWTPEASLPDTASEMKLHVEASNL